MSDNSQQTPVFTSSDIIFGSVDLSSIHNLIIILVKFYIYQQRIKKCIPYFNRFIEYLKYYQKIEKQIYVNKGKTDDFEFRWNYLMLI